MYLAIDYGKKRIGLALGEILPKGGGFIDGTLPPGEIIEKLKELVAKHEVGGIVIGNPVRNQGEAGTLSDEIKEFGYKIEEETGLPVYYEEEQFTSEEANAILQDKKNRSKTDIDEMSAILILEQFLNHQNKL
jgi:putative Holliday junction resolvase